MFNKQMKTRFLSYCWAVRKADNGDDISLYFSLANVYIMALLDAEVITQDEYSNLMFLILDAHERSLRLVMDKIMKEYDENPEERIIY